MSQPTPVRFESTHETSKSLQNDWSFTAKVVIEDYRPNENVHLWRGAIFGREGRNPIEGHQTLVEGKSPDEVRRKLATALRSIAEDLDKSTLP